MREEELKLKPCPFCGERLGWDDLWTKDDGLHYVSCCGCGARTGLSYTIEGAMGFWNARAKEATPMTEAEQVLTIARRELGVKESPAGSNRQKYGEAYGLNGQPWCVIFLWWCFREAGLSRLFYSGGRCASCMILRDQAKADGEWVTSGYRPGDLVQMDFTGDGVADHIGIVESVSADGKSVFTYEGNTGNWSQDNGGCVMRKARAASCIVGAVRPRYDSIQKEDTMDVTSLDFSKLTTEQTLQILNRIQSCLGTGLVSPGLANEYEAARQDKLTDGTNPQQLITRAQAAVMAERAVQAAAARGEAGAASAAQKAVAAAMEEIARAAQARAEMMK